MCVYIYVYMMLTHVKRQLPSCQIFYIYYCYFLESRTDHNTQISWALYCFKNVKKKSEEGIRAE